MRNFSTTPPKGAGEEFRFVKLSSISGGEVEPAAIKYGADGNPKDLMLLGRNGTISPAYIESWGPLVTAGGDDFVGSLREAQQKMLNIHVNEEGINCPCCGQLVKIYKRKLNSGMAAALVWLVGEFKRTQDWIDIPAKAPRHVIKSREHGRLVHWGLIEQKPNEDSAKKTSGLWRPTLLGVDSVEGTVSVRSHVFLLNNEMQGFSDSSVFIKDALGSDFNYAELMRG